MSQQLSRRSILRHAAASAAAPAILSLSAPASLLARQAPDRFAGFLIGLQTYTLRGFSAEQALNHARDLGFATVEMFDAHFPGKSSTEEVANRKAQVAQRGLKLLAHGVNPFTADHQDNRRWFEFAQAAGIRNLSADPTEDAFDSLDKLVAEFNIRIAIHNHGPGARYDKVADVLKAIQGHHPLIGACADLGHYIRSGEDPVRAIRLFKGRLYGIHLKDFAEQKADTKGVILGQGHLNVSGVFRALREVDFPHDACLALEYEERPENPLDDVRACLAAAEEGAQKSRA